MFRNALALSAALILTACGGGSIDLGPADSEIGIPANEFRSGYVKSNGQVFTADGGLRIRVGDYTNNDYARGFYSFPISGIPAGATILEANIRLRQVQVVNDPYADLGGQVRVDHVDLGASLSAGDFSTIGAATITNNIGLISLDANEEEKGVDVLAEVLADHAAARPNSEFRLRFPTVFSNDGQSDQARFNTPANDGGTGFFPVLIVRYEL